MEKKKKKKKKIKQEILSNPDYKNISRKETETNLVLINKEDSSCVASYFIEKITNYSLFDKIIKSTERMIRGSREYSLYLSYLNEINVLGNCSYLSLVKTDESVDIECHHHPLTLYEITAIKLTQLIMTKIPISTFLLAREVMNLHLQNMVGLVGLSKTIHELYHSSLFPIDDKRIFGNYKEFIIQYKPFMNTKIIEKLEKSVCYKNEDIDYLKKKLKVE